MKTLNMLLTLITVMMENATSYFFAINYVPFRKKKVFYFDDS